MRPREAGDRGDEHEGELKAGREELVCIPRQNADRCRGEAVVNDGRSIEHDTPRRSRVAMIVARTQLALRPVTSAYAASSGMIMKHGRAPVHAQRL